MTPWEAVKELWRPVVEITILTVGIYYAIHFVRRTRAWPVVLGIGFFLAAYIITKGLNLVVLNWLLGSFVAFLAVASVVIFQPELRRLLAEIGSLSASASSRDEREHIEVIVQGVERLAEARIGALIAIEQDVQLDELVESGVAVDCRATPEMLETIFFPNNAIHDGGVTVRKGRIIKAACIFPLTQRQDLSKSLGTRHRAAMGLSEETDAVVVAVSEETGQISYAFKGQLQKPVSVEELRSFLTSVFVKPGASRTVIQSLRSRTKDRVKRLGILFAGPEGK